LVGRGPSDSAAEVESAVPRRGGSDTGKPLGCGLATPVKVVGGGKIFDGEGVQILARAGQSVEDRRPEADAGPMRTDRDGVRLAHHRTQDLRLTRSRRRSFVRPSPRNADHYTSR